jgi:hypothetical protein
MTLTEEFALAVVWRMAVRWSLSIDIDNQSRFSTVREPTDVSNLAIL